MHKGANYKNKSEGNLACTAEVGPYTDLRRFMRGRKGIQAHHIVAIEHLEIVSTGYTEANAPAVLIPESLHQKVVSPRITAEQNYLGGRRGGKAQAIRIAKRIFS
ncbi:hypothetical protein C2L65_21400 [Paraburkholderia terrae]|uniref:Uncharacterized protein n=1 Tax=Paraburkholderia terrae TaxID=311230 RepID=A0A2I8ERY3_9BURK|nr:hypothetical protein C2L65_21400 [Paraburkholderia terrae]